VQSVVSIVFQFAIERNDDDTVTIINPAAKVKKIRKPKTEARANRPWADEEWEAVIAAAPPHLLAPILLAGVLGYREGEVLSVKRDTWNSRSGTLSRISSKSGKPVTVPAPEEIDRVLRALPPHNAVTLLVNSRGQPWTGNGFRSSFFKLIGELQDQGKVAAGLTFHGLRHTAATKLRQLGFDTRTIADMLGQETEGMAAHYSREADLAPKLRGVVQRLDLENRKRTKMSN
jgi:integrase